MNTAVKAPTTIRISVEAPNGETLEGFVDAAVDREEPFTMACAATGERFRVLQPWDCEIEVLP